MFGRTAEIGVYGVGDDSVIPETILLASSGASHALLQPSTQTLYVTSHEH